MRDENLSESVAKISVDKEPLDVQQQKLALVKWDKLRPQKDTFFQATFFSGYTPKN